MNFLGEIGIDFNILIAQIINFLALVFILWWLLYKPLVRMFEERERRTKQLAADLIDLEQKEKDSTEKGRKTLKESEEAAEEILEHSRKTVAQFKEERLASTEREVDRLVEESKERILAEQTNIKRELQASAAGDVLNAVRGIVLELELDTDMHARLMKACRTGLPVELKTAGVAAGTGKVSVVSPVSLAKSEQAYFVSLLKKKLGLVSDVVFASDPSLVAGVVLKFDSGHFFDFSFSGALEKKYSDSLRA